MDTWMRPRQTRGEERKSETQCEAGLTVAGGVDGKIRQPKDDLKN